MSSAANDPHDEPATVVDGDAVELPSDSAADRMEPPVAAPAPPVYEPEPYAARAYASPSGSAPSGRGWPDPGIDLAERPEIVVGAAFGGGLLLALILRKLGH